jgi:hypothetical protein
VQQNTQTQRRREHRIRGMHRKARKGVRPHSPLRTLGWACLAVAMAFSAVLMSLKAWELLVALLLVGEQEKSRAAQTNAQRFHRDTL